MRVIVLLLLLALALAAVALPTQAENPFSAARLLRKSGGAAPSEPLVADFEQPAVADGSEEPDAAVSSSPSLGASYVRPVDKRFPITANYRKPGSWAAGYHTGIDLGCPVGTPVYATIAGDVRERGWGAAYGNIVYVNDDVDGSDWGYAHLSRKVVSAGQKVKTGQLLGYSGATGRVFGPHLHLERRPRNGGYGSDKNPNLWP